ncbi:MAG TPA: 2-amino-4-hydroxy-6-hydroxymethyldihydropteridine diphosphokinase, partial [Burkholderiaceae bacterium]|nr:2-amino-4-hydroxy-6-hydroxymethyldihydropteridine diphosphokinase [Burkholderiaceae bacterium]
LTPLALLHALQTIETRHGRTRPYHHAPRTLDLDILFYGDETINQPELTLPHPRMHQRAFVLEPLCELAPDHMIAGETVNRWRQRCTDQPIERMTNGPFWTPSSPADSR